MNRVAIIGGGLTGLTAGYRLTQLGAKVTVFEKERRLGGLAKTVQEKDWSVPVESYPHHLFASDRAALDLIAQLGLKDQLTWHQGRTAYLGPNGFFRLDSPLTLLQNPQLNLCQKGRTGLMALAIKTGSRWQPLANQTAWQWTEKRFGPKAASLLWQPLLTKKFGPWAKKVNAAWLWGRIKKRSFRLGYLEGSLDQLTNRLAQTIKQGGGEVRLNQAVEKIKPLRKKFDQILITTNNHLFYQLTDQTNKKALPDHLGSLCFLLVLKKPLLKEETYWLNLTDPTIPFVFLDEHTNLIDKRQYAHQNLVYLGGYYPQDHPYFNLSSQKLLDLFLPHLTKINPNFRKDWLVSSHLTKDLASQPVFPPRAQTKLLPFKTSLAGVYLANFDQIFPWDRGVNYAIQAGLEAADQISQK